MRCHVELCSLNRSTGVDVRGRRFGARRDLVGAAGSAFVISRLQIVRRLLLADCPGQHEGMAHAGCGDWGKVKMRSGCEDSQNKEPTILKQARRRAR